MTTPVLPSSESTLDIPTVSFSQLQSWDRCEFQWHLGYSLGFKSPEKKRGLEIGSMGHACLADYYTLLMEEGMPASVWIETRLPAISTEWVENVDEASDLTNIALVSWVVRRYMESVDLRDQGHKVLSVEEHFLLPQVTPKGRDYMIQGYTDLTTLDPQGRLYLWDHKFTSKFWSPVEVLMDSQMPTYGAAMRDSGRDVFAIIINQVNNYDYKDKNKVTDDKLFKRDVTYRTAKELDSIKLETGSMVDDLIDNHKNPRRSLKRDCKMCQFQEPCLMSLKGIPIEVVLQDTFVKRTPREIPTQSEGIILDLS